MCYFFHCRIIRLSQMLLRRQCPLYSAREREWVECCVGRSLSKVAVKTGENTTTCCCCPSTRGDRQVGSQSGTCCSLSLPPPPFLAFLPMVSKRAISKHGEKRGRRTPFYIQGGSAPCGPGFCCHQRRKFRQGSQRNIQHIQDSLGVQSQPVQGDRSPRGSLMLRKINGTPRGQKRVAKMKNLNIQGGLPIK